jgi:hypothetical protein
VNNRIATTEADMRTRTPDPPPDDPRNALTTIRTDVGINVSQVGLKALSLAQPAGNHLLASSSHTSTVNTVNYLGFKRVYGQGRLTASRVACTPASVKSDKGS